MKIATVLISVVLVGIASLLLCFGIRESADKIAIRHSEQDARLPAGWSLITDGTNWAYKNNWNGFVSMRDFSTCDEAISDCRELERSVARGGSQNPHTNWPVARCK